MTPRIVELTTATGKRLPAVVDTRDDGGISITSAGVVVSGMFTRVEGETILLDHVADLHVNVAWCTSTWDFVTWPALPDPTVLQQQAVDVLVADMVRRARRAVA